MPPRWPVHIAGRPPLLQESPAFCAAPELLPADQQVRHGDDAAEDAHDQPHEAKCEVAVAERALRVWDGSVCTIANGATSMTLDV